MTSDGAAKNGDSEIKHFILYEGYKRGDSSSVDPATITAANPNGTSLIDTIHNRFPNATFEVISGAYNNDGARAEIEAATAQGKEKNTVFIGFSATDAVTAKEADHQGIATLIVTKDTGLIPQQVQDLQRHLNGGKQAIFQVEKNRYLPNFDALLDRVEEVHAERHGLSIEEPNKQNTPNSNQVNATGAIASPVHERAIDRHLH